MSLLLLFSVLLIPGPAAGVQANPASEEIRDRTPSDPRAEGFLKGFVDQRLYTLEGAGAETIQTRAEVAFSGAGRTPPRLGVELARKYESGETICNLVAGEPAQEAQATLARVANTLATILSPRPSAALADYCVTLIPEGEEVRLDFKPRLTSLGDPWSGWYKDDGTPLRTRFTLPAADGQGTSVMDVSFEYREEGGRLLPVRQRTSSGGVTYQMTLDYVEQNGYWVLAKLHQVAPQLEMVVTYQSILAPDLKR